MKLRVVAFGALVFAGLAGKADDVAMLLSSKFPSPSIVEEMQDRSGAHLGYKVILGENLQGVELPEDLGTVLIDLNGWSIRGTDGTTGSASDPGGNGGDAITLCKSSAYGKGPTKLTVGDDLPWPAEYMVIDVSGGSGAASYGVTYETMMSIDAAIERYNRDEYKTSKIVLRKVPKGTYRVGYEGANYLHSMTVTANKEYYIGVFATTAAQYDKVMGGSSDSTLPFYRSDRNPITTSPSYPCYADVRGTANPAETVVVSSFLGKLSTMAKASGTAVGAFDLPTELRWEIAARAGMTNEYGAFYESGRNILGTSGNVSRFSENSDNHTHGTPPASVGTHCPNLWGLYDMLGNVWESCRDGWWSFDAIQSVAEFYATDASGGCVYRGGSIWLGNSEKSPSYRYNEEYGGGQVNGFRICLEATEQGAAPVRPARGPGASAVRGGNGGDGGVPGQPGRGIVREEGVDATAGIESDAWELVGDGYKGTIVSETRRALEKIFDDGRTSVELMLTNEIYYGVKVVLGTNYPHGVSLPDNLGEVTIDLNGWSIAGTNGVDGSWLAPGGDGGDAITITNATETGEGPTRLTLSDRALWPAEFMVIDISGGSGAPSFPVSYETKVSVAEAAASYNTTDFKTTKIVLRKIPAGTYPCLTSLGTKDRLPANKPYWMGIFPVTHKQYQLVTGCADAGYDWESQVPMTNVSYSAVRGALSPSATVTADSFMGILAAKTGAGLGDFDLPTEWRWEIAARAGSFSAYGAYADAANGFETVEMADYSMLSNAAWYDVTSGGVIQGVGTKCPNVWGLYDTAGNVFEWCMDVYDRNNIYFLYGAVQQAEDFCDGSGNDRVVRGGSFESDYYFCRPSSRDNSRVASQSFDDTGFRICRFNLDDGSRPRPAEGAGPASVSGGDGGDGGSGGAGGLAVRCAADAADEAGLAFDRQNLARNGADGEVFKSVAQKELERVFGEGTVSVRFAAGGGFDHYEVVLSSNFTCGVELPDDLGAVTLDMNGFSIVGTQGPDGDDTHDGGAGGAAITFVKGPETTGHGATAVTAANGGAAGSRIVGGDGGTGTPPGAGGAAFEHADGADSGATVVVASGADVTLAAGNEGPGVTSPAQICLQNIFNDGRTAVRPIAGGTRVVLGTNYIGGVELPNDLGTVEIDLNGWSIVGRDGADSPAPQPGAAPAPGEPGGAAIKITDAADGVGGGPTKLKVVDCIRSPYVDDMAWPAEYMVIDLERLDQDDCVTYEVQNSLAEAVEAYADGAYKATKLVLRRIPAGSAYPVDPGATVYPISRVVAPNNDYYIGVYEVTKAQYDRVMGVATPRADVLPVASVSWSDICDEGGFMRRLCERTGVDGFNLPTEAQWEIAARAGSVSGLGRCLKGGSIVEGSLDDLAILYPTTVSAVGQCAPNPWGIYDALGNVSELCLNTYGLNEINPWKKDSTPSVESVYDDQDVRPVHRGGAYDTVVDNVTLSYRAYAPSKVSRNSSRGFRVMRMCGLGAKPATGDRPSHGFAVRLVGGAGGSGFPPGAGGLGVEPATALVSDAQDLVRQGRAGEAYKDGTQKVLESIFASPSVVSIVTNGTGAIVGHEIVLGCDFPDGIELPDNLGAVTIDLNGWTVRGSAGSATARTVAGSSGGAAVTFIPGGGGGTPTRLTVVDRIQSAYDDNMAWPAEYLVVDLDRLGSPDCTYREIRRSLRDALKAYSNDVYRTSRIVMRKVVAGTAYPASPGEGDNVITGTRTPEKDYFIGVFEITEAQYDRVMGVASPRTAASPVTNISWTSLHADGGFLSRLRGQAGPADFDLPTEEQWEIAARAGSPAKFGRYLNAEGELTDHLSVGISSVRKGDFAITVYNASIYGRPGEVGQRAPNAWGLYDVMGNVAELCLDFPDSDDEPVTRGGDYSNDDGLVSLCDRRKLNKGKDEVDRSTGFRLACATGYGAESAGSGSRPPHGPAAVFAGGDGFYVGRGGAIAAYASGASGDAGVEDGDLVRSGENGPYFKEAYAELDRIFGDGLTKIALNVTNGILAGVELTLGTNYPAGVVLPDDLGAVRINLNGWSIAGTNGVSGTTSTAGTDGGPAVATGAGGGVAAGATAASVFDGDGGDWPAEYVVIDLDRLDTPSCVSYEWRNSVLDAMGAYNTEEFKTRKLVMRRIKGGISYYAYPNGDFYSTYRNRFTPKNDYYIAVFDVTEAQYDRVMGEPSPSGSMLPKVGVSYNFLRSGDDDTPVNSTDPVTDGSFMGILATRTGLKGFDLPTDIQWEIAARARDESPLGSYVKDDGTVAACENLDEGSLPYAWVPMKNEGERHLHEVGGKRPNPWGLYDVHGNVFESCRDIRPHLSNEMRGYYTDVETPLAEGGDTHSFRSTCWKEYYNEDGKFGPYPISDVMAIKMDGSNATYRDFIGFRPVLVVAELSRPCPGDAAGIRGGCGGNGNPAGRGGVGIACLAEGGDPDGLVSDGANGLTLLPDVVATTEFTYDGTEKRPVADTNVYEFAGDICATNAGSYTVRITPAAGYAWGDGTAATTNTAWKILPRPVTIESGSTGWTYDAKAHAYTNLTATGFVAGEGLATTTDWATITNVGTNGNAFAYTLKGNTLPANYSIACVTGTLAVTSAALEPEDDPDRGYPAADVDPTDPSVIANAAVPFSAFDTTNCYDGAAHTIDTNALVAAYQGKFLGNVPTVTYALAQDGEWTALAPDFTDATVTSVWFKVWAANFEDVIRPAKVIVTNHAVTITFAAADKAFDGTAAATCTATNFANVVDGEGFALDTSAMTFAFDNAAVGEGKTVTATGYGDELVSALAGTKKSNYAFTFLPTAAASITADWPSDWPQDVDQVVQEKIADWMMKYGVISFEGKEDAFLMNADPNGTVPSLKVESIVVEGSKATIVVVAEGVNLETGINGKLYVDASDDVANWTTVKIGLPDDFAEGKATFEVESGKFMRANVGFRVPDSK